LADSTAGTRDVISDFSRAEKDRISLSDLDANSIAGGDQKFALSEPRHSAAWRASCTISTPAGAPSSRVT
jgi:hypothetical protein